MADNGDFSSLCFDEPKTWNIPSSGVQNRENEKRETGNDYDVISWHLLSRKIDFSDSFLFCYKQPIFVAFVG